MIRAATLLAPLLLAASSACGEGSAAAAPPGGGLVHASAPATEAHPAPRAVESRGPEPVTRAWDAPLRAIVARWLERARKQTKGKVGPGNVHVGMHVRDGASGVELAALDADRPKRPASNMKLVTTASALVLFGPDARFVTPFEAAGPLRDGRLAGDLVVRAGGDPLVEPDSDPRVEPRLAEVARALVAAGLREVEGDLVLDEGSFQKPAPGPAWPDPSQRWQEYCALAGGFSVNGGVLVAEVTPTTPGAPARVEVHPSPHGLRSDYSVETVRGGRIEVGGDANDERCLVRGKIGADAPVFRAEFRHPDPVRHFGAVLSAALAGAGIRVDGTVRRDRNVPGGPVLARLTSPLAGCLRPINAESRNGVADQLFLALGHGLGRGGTRESGQEATRTALERLGVPVDGLHQVDGSGLSFESSVAPRQITALLAAVMALDEDTRRRFVDSLATAGAKGTTLDDRMRGTSAEGRVHAKTGWIRGTSALSGLARTLEGRELYFSILVEYPPDASGLNSAVFKPMQDELATFLVEEPVPLRAGGESHDAVR